MLCVPHGLLGDAGMRTGGPAGPELPLPWCPARRRRRHGAARGGAAPQHAGPARPRGARLQGNDVTMASSGRRHCPSLRERGAGRGSRGCAGDGRCPSLRGSVLRGAPRPSGAGHDPPEPLRPARVDAQRGVRPARPGTRGKVTAAPTAAPALTAGP